MPGFKYHPFMDISARDFEAQPSVFLRRAEAGETIVVTDHGRPIAELRPIPVAANSEEGALLELVRAGMITPPARIRGSQGAPLRLAGVPISQALLEDRKDRF